MSRRPVLLALALLVLALLGWWWLRDRKPDATVDTAEPSAATTLEMRRAARKDPSQGRSTPAIVSGQVRDQEGAPIAGALVEARESSLEGISTEVTATGMRHSAVTGADGRYRIGGLSPGTYSVSASARAHAPALKKGLVLAPGEDRGGIDLVLGQGGHLLSGKVSDIGGGPVAGATVRVTPLFEGSLVDMLFASYSTVTDEGGNYEIYLLAGQYAVIAQHPDYTRDDDSVIIDDGPRTLDFRLIPGAIVRGRVIMAGTGDPVGGAMVIDRGDAGGFVISGFGESATKSDAEGRFELRGLRPGSYSLTASGRGFRAPDPVRVEVGVGEEVDGLEIVVDKAFTISGFVVRTGNRDQPVAGALIGAYNLRPGAMLVAPRRTESDGYFEIHGVPPGFYNVGVFADDHVPQLTGASTEVVDSDIEELIVEVDSGVTIRGRVEPATSARIRSEIDPEDVSFMTIISTVSKSLLHARADERGEFELKGVGSGRLTLVAQADDGRAGKIELAVGGEDIEGVVIQLEARPVLAGRVVDRRGSPVANVSVEVSPKRKNGGFNITMMQARGTPVRPDGTFRVLGLEPGAYEVSVEGKTGELPLAGKDTEIEIELPAEGKDDLVLEVPELDGVISGEVRGAAGPVADAMVRVVPKEQRWMAETAMTDGDGKFEVTGLAKGTYAVEVRGSGAVGYGEKDAVDTGSHVVIELSAWASLELSLASEGNACIANLSGPTRRRDAIRGTGPVRFTRLETGDYTVSVSCDQAFGQSKLSLKPGAEERRSVTLGPYSTLAGRVLNKDGEPVSGLTLFAQTTDGDFDLSEGMDVLTGTGPRTDGEGRFRIDKIRAGDGMLVMSKGSFGDGMDAKPYSVGLGEEKDLGDLVFEPKLRGPGDEDDENEDADD